MMALTKQEHDRMIDVMERFGQADSIPAPWRRELTMLIAASMTEVGMMEFSHMLSGFPSTVGGADRFSYISEALASSAYVSAIPAQWRQAVTRVIARGLVAYDDLCALGRRQGVVSVSLLALGDKALLMELMEEADDGAGMPREWQDTIARSVAAALGEYAKIRMEKRMSGEDEAAFMRMHATITGKRSAAV